MNIINILQLIGDITYLNFSVIPTINTEEKTDYLHLVLHFYREA